MSNATQKIRVRLRNQNHPTLQRRRAGFIFGVQPTIVEVTDEQYAAVKADAYLQILPLAGKDTDEDEGGEDGDDKKPEIKEENLGRAKKERLVQILTDELKLIPGLDFNPEASNEILKKLITDLRAKAAEGNKGDDGNDDDDDGNGDGDDDEGGEDEGSEEQ